MFDEVRAANRSTSSYYFEVWVQADDDVRQSRKPLIAGSRPEEVVSSQNESYQLPRDADLVLDNAGDRTPFELAKVIFARLRKAGF
jgi:hypothetical protein